MLSAPELRLLARLDLAHHRLARGQTAGERRSPRSARSAEFSDFRPYVAGDDFRQIDWKAFARLERLSLRLYVAEDEACLNIVVDTSASMAMGAPPKWPSVRRLAGALACLGLAGMDRVLLGTLDGRWLPPQRGRGGVARAWSFLDRLEPAGPSGPEELARLRWPRPGVTVVLSDFLAGDPDTGPADWAPALAHLGGHRQEPVLWQVLSPDEERPPLAGDVRLVDSETGRDREVTISPGLLAEYSAALAALRGGLRQAARRAGGRYLASSSDADLEAAMVAALRAGVVRRT